MTDPIEPIIEPWVVPGSEDLPEEVKNGEVLEDEDPGEDDPAIADQPPTTDE